MMDITQSVYIARGVYDMMMAGSTDIPLPGVTDDKDRTYHLKGREVKEIPPGARKVEMRGYQPTPHPDDLLALAKALQGVMKAPPHTCFYTNHGRIVRWEIAEPFEPYDKTLFWNENGSQKDKGQVKHE